MCRRSRQYLREWWQSSVEPCSLSSFSLDDQRVLYSSSKTSFITCFYIIYTSAFEVNIPRIEAVSLLLIVLLREVIIITLQNSCRLNSVDDSTQTRIRLLYNGFCDLSSFFFQPWT